MLNKRYTINESIAISETIDEETIIINLETGYYYSVNKTASVLWNKIKDNNSTENILQYFLNHYEVDKTTAAKYLTEIINLLFKDDLILESESDSSSDSIENPPASIKEPFIIPKIERYDDMAGALLADPVHNANEDGWPNLK